MVSKTQTAVRRTDFETSANTYYFSILLQLDLFVEAIDVDIDRSQSLSVCLSSLPQLFALFEVLSVVVFVIRDRFVKKPTCAEIFFLV